MSDMIRVRTCDNDGNAVTREIRAGRYLECGCCGEYHHERFYGDCRDNDERFGWFQLEKPDGRPVSRKIQLLRLDAKGEKHLKG